MPNFFDHKAYPDEELWFLKNAEGEKLFCYKRYREESYFGRRSRALEAEYGALRLTQALLLGSPLFEVCPQVELLSFNDEASDRPRGQVLKTSYIEGVSFRKLSLAKARDHALPIVTLALVDKLLLGGGLSELEGIKLTAGGKFSIDAMQLIAKTDSVHSIEMARQSPDIAGLLDSLADSEVDRTTLFRKAVGRLFGIVVKAATRLSDVDMEDSLIGLELKSVIETNIDYVKNLCLYYLKPSELVEVFSASVDFDELPLAAPAA